MRLHYLIGDATEPIKRPAIIAHCCNDAGGFGRGFVVALSKKWPEPEKVYRAASSYQLGSVQFVRVEPDIQVANIIGQHGIRWDGKIPPIRYQAIEAGLREVFSVALKQGTSVHAPRLGCVLAGGSWDVIEKIIKNNMTVDTYVYTLESQKDRWPTDYESI